MGNIIAQIVGEIIFQVPMSGSNGKGTPKDVEKSPARELQKEQETLPKNGAFRWLRRKPNDGNAAKPTAAQVSVKKQQ
jgi:hypothetical protein